MGGILILFIYLCRLNSKIKIELEKRYNFFLILGLSVLLFFLINFFAPLQINLRNFRVFRLYSKFNIGLVIFIVLYLTIGLLVRIHLIDKMYGPLKQSY